MKLRLVILILTAAISALGNRNQPRGPLPAPKVVSPCVQTTLDIIRQKIYSVHELKWTFEELFPIESNSIAQRYPEFYEMVRRLFHDRPSYLLGMNRNNPPKPGMRLGEIYGNINNFADEIGTSLAYYAKNSIPEKDWAQDIIKYYIEKFRGGKVRRSRESDNALFDPNNRQQLAELTVHGKGIICSVWSELRLSLRIGGISRVGKKVWELIEEGILPDPLGIFRSHMKNEIDHLWYPRYAPHPLELKDEVAAPRLPRLDRYPDAVAIGETKVFDLPFDRNTERERRKDVYEKLRTLLEIASRIGANRGLPPELYYFFVAGISEEERAKFNQIADEFNATRTGEFPPVKLYVYGVYGGH
jgi:hypothetical protein